MGIKRAVVYCRASLDITGEQNSVTRQEEACRALIVARGWSLVDVVIDNSVSAYGKKVRKGWMQINQMITSGAVDVVVAWHLDRITRNMNDLEQLILLSDRHGVGVATATGDIDLTTDVGRMVARILAAVARAEVERKGERQRSGNQQRAARGGRTVGMRPFGYTSDQTDVVPDEAEAIRKAADDLLNGNASLAGIAREWAAKGFTTSQRRNGKVTTWSSSGVKVVLTNPRYMGKRVYRGEIVADAKWPAILTEDVFNSLQHLLKMRGKDMRPAGLLASGMKPLNLLTKIALCGDCGAPMRATTRKARKDAGCTTKVYECSASTKCTVIERRDVDTFIERVALRRLMQADAPSLLGKKEGGRLEALRDEQLAASTRLKELSEAFAGGLITLAQLTSGSSALKARLEVIQGELEQMSRSQALVELAGRDDVEQRWYGTDEDDQPLLSIGRKREIVKALMQEIRVKTPGRGLKPFLGIENVEITWANAPK
ncbi:recombinase family protein [Lentzea sp. CC55]|uniref:recombinase family protein n=1 Tax=Lentzea sp. CC55 TaxID=2884909 RepID=UPI0027E0C69C|nr:recombinase family protein [Lentzea sp. CC55]MCG8926611.1 recombinase family protein [Lentzea sp. CC55]